MSSCVPPRRPASHITTASPPMTMTATAAHITASKLYSTHRRTWPGRSLARLMEMRKTSSAPMVAHGHTAATAHHLACGTVTRCHARRNPCESKLPGPGGGVMVYPVFGVQYTGAPLLEKWATRLTTLSRYAALNRTPALNVGTVTP